MKKGLTLVELLVTLVILAAIATSVAVSLNGIDERRRVDDTIRRGYAVRDALESPDGLSAVSDLGPFLDASYTDAQNLARLGYLFCIENPYDVIVTEDGEVTTNKVTKTAPAFASVTTNAAPFIKDSLSSTAAASIPDTTNITLQCGWRGPYCTERMMDDGGILRDGFGGAWELYVSTTNTVLVSRGRDMEEDGLDTNKDWRDMDRVFEIRRPDELTLTVSIDEDSVGEAVGRLCVFAFWPRLDIPSASGKAPSMMVEMRHFAATNMASLVINDALTIGQRKLFVVAESSSGAYLGSRLADVVLRPGVNELKNLKLLK